MIQIFLTLRRVCLPNGGIKGQHEGAGAKHIDVPAGGLGLGEMDLERDILFTDFHRGDKTRWLLREILDEKLASYR